MVVWARTTSGQRGICAFIVEGKTPGLHVGKAEDKMGLRGSSTASLTFEDCAIPVDNLLGQEGDGFKLAMIALDGGRIGIASQACGVTRAALEASLRYARDRRAFEKRLPEVPAVQWVLAHIPTDLNAPQVPTLRPA